jgi:hypothetical protein
MFKNVLSRQTPYFRRHLAINKKKTNIKVIKLKKTDSPLEKFGGLSSIDGEVCFVMEHAKNFDTVFFNVRVDIVCTNIYHKVLKTFSDVSPDNILDTPKMTTNIWIFKVGTIDFFKIKCNDVVNTKS